MLVMAHLDSVVAGGGGSPEAEAVSACQKKKFGQPLLHQTSEALITPFERRAVNVLNYWKHRERQSKVTYRTP